MIAGTIAERRHDYTRMKIASSRALTRNHSDWYAWLELGIAEYETGNRSAALAQLERAKSLNPREPITRLVLHSVRAHKVIGLASIDKAFLDRALLYALGKS